MLTDCKIHRLVEKPDGVECVVRIYEGAITTEDEFDAMTFETKPVTRYRRTGMVAELTVSAPAGTTEEQIRAMAKEKLTQRVTAEKRKGRTVDVLTAKALSDATKDA